MIGVRLVNLIVPGDPERFVVAGAHGDWVLDREPDFEGRKAVVPARKVRNCAGRGLTPDYGPGSTMPASRKGSSARQ